MQTTTNYFGLLYHLYTTLYQYFMLLKQTRDVYTKIKYNKYQTYHKHPTCHVYKKPFSMVTNGQNLGQIGTCDTVSKMIKKGN